MALLGPPSKTKLPALPPETEGLRGVYRYLHDLDKQLSVFSSTLVSGTFGLLGTLGISGTGLAARNLRGNVTIVGATNTGTVTLLNMEANASYFLALGVHPGIGTPTSTISVQWSAPTATNFAVTLSQNPGISNSIIVDWHLLR